MILKHRDTSLVRFEWTSSEEVRVDFVDERSMRDAEFIRRKGSDKTGSREVLI